LSYRAAYGSFIGSLFMFGLTATFVWGGLAVCLRMMLSDEEEIDLAAPESIEIESSEAVLIAENA